MYIDLDYRDRLPKMGLFNRYIGDGLPLCSDLPQQHFLKQGATYRLLGGRSTPLLHEEPDRWATDSSIVRFKLSQGSNLYNAICGGGSDCAYPSKVELTSDIACVGDECNIEAPRQIEVGDGIFYEYERPQCAYQAFFNGGQQLKPKQWRLTCGDPRLEIGGIACCTPKSNNWDHTDPLWHRFSGERVRYATAASICANNGLVVCERQNIDCNLGVCDDNELSYWNSQSCSVQTKINTDGTIALVHNVPEGVGNSGRVQYAVRSNTKTYFRAAWETSIDGLFNTQANYDASCTSMGCGRSDDNMCLCDASVIEEAAFISDPATSEEVLALYIGAFAPGGTPSATLSNGVKVYHVNGLYTTETIFEIEDEFGVTRYLKNLKSTVAIGSPTLELKFRNPAHVISLTEWNTRDAQYETDAAIDHYFVSPKTL